jgi:hypothetical protein
VRGEASNPEEKMFVPQINKKSKQIKRETKIEETLLYDAKRRQEKYTQRETRYETHSKIVSKSSMNIIY